MRPEEVGLVVMRVEAHLSSVCASGLTMRAFGVTAGAREVGLSKRGSSSFPAGRPPPALLVPRHRRSLQQGPRPRRSTRFFFEISGVSGAVYRATVGGWLADVGGLVGAPQLYRKGHLRPRLRYVDCGKFIRPINLAMTAPTRTTAAMPPSSDAGRMWADGQFLSGLRDYSRCRTYSL